MTDPATVRRRLDELIRTQILTLNQDKPLTEFDLLDYHARHNEISTLFREMDRSKPLPDYPTRKRKIHYPDASL